MHSTMSDVQRPYEALVRALTNRRLELGLAQTDTAAKIGVASSTLSRWEALAVVAPTDAAMAWAEALGIPLRLSEPPPMVAREPEGPSWRVPRRPRC